MTEKRRKKINEKTDMLSDGVNNYFNNFIENKRCNLNYCKLNNVNTVYIIYK